MHCCSLILLNLFIRLSKAGDGDYDNLPETTSEFRMKSINVGEKVYNKCEIDLVPRSRMEIERDYSCTDIIFSPISRWSYSALTFLLCLVAIFLGVFYFMNRKYFNSAICGGIFCGLIFLILIYLFSFKCWERRIIKNYQQSRYNRI